MFCTPESSSRSRRQKHDKHGRFAALKKLKDQKGNKHKAALNDDVDNVYDLVDEKEYSKRVLSRQCDDWIVDGILVANLLNEHQLLIFTSYFSEGSGYVEDGREIFDDDMDEESIAKQSKDKGGRKRKSKSQQDDAENSKGSGNIRHMLSNMQPKKKKTENANIDNDELLGELMKDLEAKPLAPAPEKPVQNLKSPNVQRPTPIQSQPARIVPERPKPVVPVVTIKNEPTEEAIPASQFIDEADSMDCFSEHDFAEVEISFHMVYK